MCASYIYHSHVRRAKASRRWLDFALQLHWCDAERTTAKNPICAGSWYKRGFLNFFFFFVKADVLFWKRSSFVYLEESVRVPSFVPQSPRFVTVVDREDWCFWNQWAAFPDYPTLKNDSHEAWKCSVTRKKYFERPHTAGFRRQRLGTTPSTQIFKQDDRFGAKRRRLLLWSVREHLIGLASATSQLDRNAWQRVATYKSGSKQTWRRIFFVWNHIEKAHAHRRIEQQPSFYFAEQLQPGLSCLLSSGSDSVLYSKFLCYVSGSSSRIAQCSTCPELMPWRRPVEANHLVFLGCSFVRWTLYRSF